MAANGVRFSASICLRRLSNPLKGNSSGAGRISRLFVSSRSAATCVSGQNIGTKALISNKGTNFVQMASRNVQISRRIQELAPILSCNVLALEVHSGSSATLEESAGEEEEATSGRKRPINWPGFMKDDP